MDDRLIHGQVVVGWVQALGAKRILVIDDDLVESEWQRQLFALGTPPGLTVEFASVADAPPAMELAAGSPEKTIVLAADVRTVVRLCRVTPSITALNLGGVHDGTSRSKRLPYLFLSDEEAQALEQLRAGGIRVSAQDVPSARPVPLEELL